MATLALMLTGCASGGGDTATAHAGDAAGDRLAVQEQSFRPSAYNPAVASVITREHELLKELATSAMITVAAPETVPGFRIQVTLTQEIDKANAVYDTLSNLLADEWVYVVYDSPYYKVRVGNFADRPSAAVMLSLLGNKGYGDAWIVPDKVLKNPPPRLSPQLLNEERPVERQW